jgi:hypothetical protein
LELGGELEIRLLTPAVTVSAGSDDQLRIAVRNVARSEIRGEVQIISPHETWPFIRPWTQGFAVAPAATMTVTFEIDPPFETEPGAYWALAKVMYFGRLYYCEAVPIVITQDRPAKETKS